jgi:hypothetical protein
MDINHLHVARRTFQFERLPFVVSWLAGVPVFLKGDNNKRVDVTRVKATATDYHCSIFLCVTPETFSPLVFFGFFFLTSHAAHYFNELEGKVKEKKAGEERRKTGAKEIE